MNDLTRRLEDAGAALGGLRDELVAGEPWPLSGAYGTEPEADWGPREVLAHVNEMVPYWTGQFQMVLDGDPATAVPFGRTSSDPGRLGRIAEDRRLPVGELLDRITIGLDRAATFMEGLTDGELARRGAHTIRGDLTITEGLERFLVGHLEDHVDQLRAILGRSHVG
jgi:DinB family protein